MSKPPKRVQEAFARNGAFEALDEGGYEVTTTPFDAAIRLADADPPTYAVAVRAPTLSAAVEEEVAPVVEDGWLETFERRMEDAHMPLAGTDDLEPTVAVEDSDLVVTATLQDPDPRRGVDDVRALVDYVEGTYLAGVIPGYTYREPVASLRAEARQAYDANDDTNEGI